MILFAKLLTFDDVNNFAILKGAAFLCAILRAHDNIIAQIQTAEAQVCANWVALRKSAILLAPLIFLNKKCCYFVS